MRKPKNNDSGRMFLTVALGDGLLRYQGPLKRGLHWGGKESKKLRSVKISPKERFWEKREEKCGSGTSGSSRSIINPTQKENSKFLNMEIHAILQNCNSVLRRPPFFFKTRRKVKIFD